MNKALKTISLKRNIWIVKHISGYCATGKQMKRWKKRETAECPMCPAIEDHHHVIKCKSTSTTTQWGQCTEEYCTALRQMQTPQETINAVMSLLVEYRYETQPIETE